MNLKTTLSFLLFISFILCNAQTLTPEEKKELVKEIKELKKNPEKYKFLKESAEMKDVIIVEQNNEIVVLKKDIQKKDLNIKSLNDSLMVVKKAEAASAAKTVYVKGPENVGYKYRVQVGLFQNLDLSNFLIDDAKFFIHEYIDGKHRYSIGNFTTEEEAEAFKENLRRLGLKDAFVSEYQDGDRVY